MPTSGSPPPVRRTRTVALPQELHDQLRVLALQHTLAQHRRITIQDLVEQALHAYLAQQGYTPAAPSVQPAASEGSTPGDPDPTTTPVAVGPSTLGLVSPP